MSISDYIGLISPKLFGTLSGEGNQSYDLSDKTFSDILANQLRSESDFINSPVGINIGNFNISSATADTNVSNPLERVNEINLETGSTFSDFENKDVTTSELLTFYPSIFDSKPDLTSTSTNGLFKFERKVAANSYGKYARNVVTDLNEFVTDTIKAKS